MVLFLTFFFFVFAFLFPSPLPPTTSRSSLLSPSHPDSPEGGDCLQKREGSGLGEPSGSTGGLVVVGVDGWGAPPAAAGQPPGVGRGAPLALSVGSRPFALHARGERKGSPLSPIPAPKHPSDEERGP